MTRIIFVDSKWEGDLTLGDKVIKYLKDKKIKSLALFASVQFVHFDKVIEQIKELGIEVKLTKAKRTSQIGQILGCDAYHDSFQEPIIKESDAIMYIGDGLFHPKALLLSQIKEKEFKPVVIFDPIQNKVEEINKKTIEKQLQKYKRNLKLFLNSEKIGVLVTIKPGQQYFLAAKKLKDNLEKQGKKVYIFIDNTININNLENYPFIQAWVNTACPRIGTDDIVNIKQPLINLREAFDPIKALEELE